MTVSTEYEFDLSVVEAVIRRLPETFDTYDVSQHPDMIRAHTLLSTHRAWHSVVGMCLARQIRGLEPLPARRRGMQMWRKVKQAPTLDDLSAPTMLMPVLREGA
jgi:hypothetical protein